jgi:hypothetical protein
MCASCRLRRHEPGRRPGWRPSIWTYSLVIAWLAMLMLGGAGDGGAAATSQPGIQQPGMPIYVPIV